MAGHTPGPWEAVDSMTVRGPFAMGDSDKPGLLVASLPVELPPGERAANARLIAAAPAMLETLQRMEGWLRESGYGENHPWRLSLNEGIAKATGSAS